MLWVVPYLLTLLFLLKCALLNVVTCQLFSANSTYLLNIDEQQPLDSSFVLIFVYVAGNMNTKPVN